ncbi:uncharacterized protein [Dendropsophus ebraccatus]|uniref:uncharacterized protein isoform X2 n=1 Tax=Dendropsophus ebraccatus TaxID=150705 RepID=UPI003831726D
MAGHFLFSAVGSVPSLQPAMKSVLLLLRLCLLIPGMSAIDVFAATGDTMMLPLHTRLQYTSGGICNRYEWMYKGRYERYLRRLAGVDDKCGRRECDQEARPRCSLSNNGSLQLYQVTDEDAGEYTITTFGLDNAKPTSSETIILHIMDGVSQPDLRLQCRPNNQTVVSCRTENGTNISTSITVNGKLLLERSGCDGEENLSNVSAPWNISCSAANKVSRRTITLWSQTCPDPLSDPRLEITCPSDGCVRVSCMTSALASSFSWFVDGNLVQPSSSWNVTENVMSGCPRVPMNISCSARNFVSEVHTPVTTVSCSASHQAIPIFRKILLYAHYNVLLICMMRDMMISNPNTP